MAEVQSIKEEFLTCSICTEIYTDPCTLGCQHSFCRKCVTDYIKTRPDAVQSRTIPCAMCRQNTPVPNPTRPVTEWAEQLRPSLMLQGLMDKLHSGHKHVEGHESCFMCKEIGETTPASSWCSDCHITLCSRCARLHLKTPSTRDHDVSDQDVRVKPKERSNVNCKEHDGEQIASICKNCNKAVCQTCCITNHKTCTNVVSIESLIPEIKAALTEKRLILEEKMKANIAVVRQEEVIVEQLKANENNIKEDIKSTIEDAITFLRERENIFLLELSDAAAKQILEHQAILKSGQITTQMYQQHCEFIDQALNSESNIDMYKMYQVCLSGTVDSVGDSESDAKSTPVVGELKFTSNMEPLKKAVIEIGVIDATLLTSETTVSLTQSKLDAIFLSTPVLQDAINVQHSSDKNEPRPIDVTVLNVKGVSTVVVADTSNKCLKSVYEKDGQTILSKLELPSGLYGFARIPENRLIAALSNSVIIVVDVRPELVVIATLKTCRQYKVLRLLSNSTLAAVSSYSDGKYEYGIMDIIDLRGNVLRSIKSEKKDIRLWPIYLSTTQQGNILALDSTSHSVLSLSDTKIDFFRGLPSGGRALSEPDGITITNTGNILVADSKGRIVQLDSAGNYVKELFTSFEDIGSPMSLHVDETNKLYVCQKNSDKHIKVFALQV